MLLLMNAKACALLCGMNSNEKDYTLVSTNDRHAFSRSGSFWQLTTVGKPQECDIYVGFKMHDRTFHRDHLHEGKDEQNCGCTRLPVEARACIAIIQLVRVLQGWTMSVWRTPRPLHSPPSGVHKL